MSILSVDAVIEPLTPRKKKMGVAGQIGGEKKD